MGVSTVSIDSAHIWYFRQLRHSAVIDFTILFLYPLPRPLSPTLAENLIDIRKRFWHETCRHFQTCLQHKADFKAYVNNGVTFTRNSAFTGQSTNADNTLCFPSYNNCLGKASLF